MLRTTALTIALGLTLCACGPQRPAIDPALSSGVTSSNGGGVRTTGNVNSTNIGTNGTPTTTGGSGQVGRAY